MNFTFGIISDGSNNDRVNSIINSIREQCDDEILVCIEIDKYSSFNDKLNNTYRINCPLDKKSWITKKKNMIAYYARHENIVLLHDYISLKTGWYNSWKQFGDDWDYAMNPILNFDGTRYRDWLVWDDPSYGERWTNQDVWCPEGRTFNGRPCLVPYTYNKTQYMWFSGAYFLIKKKVLLDNPFNENLCWGHGEDIELSLRLRDKYKYVINTNAIVQLMKQKDVILPYVEI